MKAFSLTCAFSYLDRLRGLFALPRDFESTLLIAPCRSIHTFGLDKNVDIAFLDASLRVIKVRKNVVPGRILNCWGAWGVLERYASSSPWFLVGGRTEFKISERKV